MALILDGRKARDFYTEKLSDRILALKNKPVLAILQIGNKQESNIYIEQKKKFGEKIGVHVVHICLPENISIDEVKREIYRLNTDNRVNGIILQLPTPEGFDLNAALNTVEPNKDVDGLSDIQRNLLTEKKDCFIPATAQGIVSLLNFYNIPVKGRRIVVLGRSRLVGTPVAQMFRNMGADVTVCHSKTTNTKEITKKADIIIVAVGKIHLVDASYISHGQVIIDVGINTVTGSHLEEEMPNKKVSGDVDFEIVLPRVSAISPVPGGVGPMTVLSLFENVVRSKEKML